MTSLSKYEKQAIDFLNETNTTISFSFKCNGKYFNEDKETRDIWHITLQNKQHKYRFTFGQSIANEGTQPTAYDVLAALTKYDPESYNIFCSNYGYDPSKNSRKVYEAVIVEWENVQKLFTPEQIEKLAEIQ